MAEAHLLAEIRLAIGTAPELRLFRQSSGVAWLPITDRGRQLLTGLVRSGDVQRVQIGPMDGAADLSGMVHGPGTRLEVEAKSERGRLRPDQERWRDWVLNNGGIWYLAKPCRGESRQETAARCAREIVDLARQRIEDR